MVYPSNSTFVQGTGLLGLLLFSLYRMYYLYKQFERVQENITTIRAHFYKVLRVLDPLVLGVLLIYTSIADPLKSHFNKGLFPTSNAVTLGGTLFYWTIIPFYGYVFYMLIFTLFSFRKNYLIYDFKFS